MSVVKTTASVAGTVVGTTVTAGTAVVATAGVAKSVTVAAVGTTVAAGSLAVTGIQAVAHSRRADDVATVTAVATAPDRFTAADGRKWITRDCADVIAGQPALWVAMRTGETVIRRPSGDHCPVLSLD
jgi:hypothetical protein